MKISVIIPIYNVQAYLRGCLDSVLKQDFSDYEVILVDDGSTDASKEIAQEYAEKYPEQVHLVRQENGGLGCARNTGMELAKGEYLVFVDSDDSVAPNLLSCLYEAAMTVPGGADIAIGGFQTVNEQGEILQTFGEGLPLGRDMTLETNPELLLIHPSAWGKIYRKGLFMDTGIRYPSRVWYEDIRTTPKLFTRASSFVYVDQPLYYYLQREGSITKNKNAKRNEEILWAFEDLLGYFEEHELMDRYHDQLEYLTVFHILLTASVRVACIDPKNELLAEFWNYTHEKFPQFLKNPYLKSLGKQRTMLLRLIDKKQYGKVRFLFKLKGFLKR